MNNNSSYHVFEHANTLIITFSSMLSIPIITFSSMRSIPIITFSSSNTIQRYKEKGYVA